MRIGRGLALAGLVSAGALGQSASSPMQKEPEHPVYATGVIPATPEEYAALPKLGRYRADLPAAVDLSASYPVPGYQGQQSNCTTWSTTYAARSFLYGKDLGRKLSVSESLSPAYVYNRTRPAGSLCDTPVQMTAALDLLKNEGTVNFAAFPDDPAKCAIPAPVALREQAREFRITSWRAIARENGSGDYRVPLVLDDIKGALSRSVPVVFSMRFEKPGFYAYKSGVYSIAGAAPDGPHSMALVGYDEARQAFRAINSWGTQWGDGGYIWIGYDTFRKQTLEAYALEAALVRAGAPKPSLQQQLATARAGLRCGVVGFRQDGGRQVATGFGGNQDSLDALRSAAFAVDGKTQWNVAFHPWPQCEAETTLGRALATPGVSVQVVNEGGGALAGDPVAMKAGDKFGFVARTNAARPYLNIVYLQADGSAVELYRGQPAAGADGGREVTLGTGGERAVRFQVGPPFGNEVLVALASVKPLFGAELASYATEREFLTGLRAHLIGQPDVSAAVLRLKTAG